MGRILSILITLFASMAFANPVGINISGRIVDDASNTALSGSVSFRVKVLTKTNCIIYSEEFNSYTIPSTGTFTFTLGKGSSPVNAYHPGNPVAAQSLQGMNDIFSNAITSSVSTLGEGGATGSPTSGDNVACGGVGVAYTPVADDIRKVRIEFDDGDGQGYKAILPYHQIRTVPYAMLAEEANNALKLGGSPAADYAKLTDIPDLSTGVPAAETDPSVKAFAKANISGLTAGACAAGQVLSYNGTALVCVADAGGSSTPIATATVVGTVMVPTTSYVSLLGTGEIDVKNLPTSKITGLDTALAGTLKVADMPASSCAAGEALIWSSPSNVFTCNAITINAAHVSDFSTAVKALALPLDGSGTMTGAINAGGNDVLATGHITMSNQKTITVGKYDQTQENTLAGTLTGSNEGATWYNSAMKALRFWDGTARQTVVSTAAACTDGQLLKWNDTTKLWYCAADAGAGGADANSINGVAVNSVPAPSADGQVLRYDLASTKWVASLIQAADLPTGIARSKIATGTANHVLINDGTGALSSEAQLATSRGGTGQSVYTDGQLLIGKTDGTLAKATLTAGTGVTVTNADGAITIAATATTPSDASYAAKGIVQLLTDAPTSGLNVSSGVISVNSGTAANQLVKLDGSAKLPAVDGSALTNVTVVADKVTSAAAKYFTYAPNNVACTNGDILVKTANGWECGAQTASPGDASYAAKGIVEFNTDAATSGVTVAAGVATVNTGTGANQIVKLDGSSKLPAVDGSALTNVGVVVDKITSAAGKYFTYLPNGAACSDGGVLKWSTASSRWECGADAGAGGADASSIRGKNVAVAAGTPAAGAFLTYDNSTTSWVASVFTDCTAAGSAIHYNATLNTWSCDALTVGSSNITDGSIVDADINAAAAIARTKLANGTAYRIVANDASGVMGDAAAITAARALISDANGIPTHSTVTSTELGYVSGVTSAIQTQIDGLSTGASGKVAKAGDTMTGNLVMNAQKEVRFADSDSSNFIGLKAPATVASDVTFTLPAADGTAGYVLKTDGSGALSWVAQTASPGDASYAAKGIVEFNTDAATSGVTVAAGVATVNFGTGANQIVKLDGSSKLPAVDGSALTNVGVVVDKITSAAGKYFTYAPNNVACSNGEILKKTANGWECAADAGSGGADATSIRGKTVAVAAGTPADGAFLTYDNSTTSWVASVFTDCTAAGSAIHYNATLNTWSCDALTIGSSNITDGSIVNADINAAAAIARTKLASGTAYRIVANDASGVMADAAAITAARALISDANGIPTHSTVTSTELGYVSGVTSAIQTQIDSLSTGGAGKVAKAGDTMTGNLVMNAQKEVRFADSDSSNSVGFKSAATVAADITWTLPAADGTSGYVLKTDGAGILSWVAQTASPGDASYAAKGIVEFNTDAATSGVTVAAGVATVNTGTGANQIVKLDGSSKLPAVDGSALTNVTVVADKVTSAAGKYFTYAPNNVACANGEILKKTANGWECGADAGAGGADASSIRGKNIAVAAGTPADGAFLTYDNSTTSWVASVFTDCTAAGSAIHYNATLNTWSCDALTIGSSNITDGSIVNADINAAAAIARTKLASGTAYRIVANDASGVMADAAAITASRALISDANGIPTHSTVTSTELGYVSGVTSAIQTQIDSLSTGGAGKVAKAGDTMTGNLVMNAQKEVRFADSDSSNFIGLKAPATVASDVTFTLPAADGTAGYVLKTDGSGALSWVAQTASPGDASYAAKGIVEFNTDAATSGVTVAAGVATVNFGTGANQIVKLDGSSKLPAVDGSALTNVGVVVDKITSAAGKYFTYAPNNVACSNGEILKKTANGWECAADAGASGADATSIRGKTVAVAAGTPAAGAFLTYDNSTTSWVASVFTDCTAAGSAIHYNATLNTWSCDALTIGSSNITDGSIVDADINASAAIARTKLASGTANRVVVNNGSGVMADAAAITASRALISDANGIPTHSTVTSTELGYVSGVTSAIQTQIDSLSTGGAGKVAKAGDTMTGNLVMNAQSEVRFADADSSNYVGLKSPATVTTNLTWTLPAADGTAGYVLKTDGSGALSWVAQTASPGDASYAAKGIVEFNTDAATSGVTVAAGVATVNFGTGANQIVKLDGSSKLPAVDGSALTNVGVVVDKITSAAGKYFTYAPNNVACATGEILKKTANGWECAADAGASGADATSIRGKTVAVAAGTPAAGAFLTYDNSTTSWVASVFTDCQSTGSAIHYNATTNTWSCDALTVGSSNITDGSIVNADINAAAAIARTKLASGTAYRIVANDASGVMGDAAAITASRALISDANGIPTHSTVTSTELGYVSGVTSAIQTQITGKVAKAGDTMTGNLVMNAQSEVRFADADSSNYVGLKSPTTVTTNLTWTLPAADGTAGYVLKTDGSGALGWVALPSAAVDSSYAAKGVVQFNTDAATSGVTVAAGVATVNFGTGANQIVKLDGSSKLPAVDGSALTNVGVVVDKITSAASKYFTYAPNNVACNTGDILAKTANGWECGTQTATPGDASYAAKGIVKMLTDAATSGLTVASGVVNVNFGTGANQIVKLDASSKLPAVDGSALTNLTAANISAGTLAVARGGTGQTSFTGYGILVADSAGTTLSGKTCAVGEHLTWTVSGWICGKDFYQTGSATSANYVRATGGATTVAPIVDAAGTDTNIDLKVSAKGTGAVNLQSKYLEKAPNGSSPSTGSHTISSDRNIHLATLTAGSAVTITLPDATGFATNTAFSLTVKTKQPASGADGTITWAAAGSAAIKWDSGVAPSPATGNGKDAIYQFVYIRDEGTNGTWYAMQVWREN